MPLPIGTQRIPVYTDAALNVISNPLTFNNQASMTVVPSLPNHLVRLQDLTSGASRPVATKTANYALTTADDTILGDATAGAITLTLPTAIGNSGRDFTLNKIDSSVNTVTIQGFGAELINGFNVQVISFQYSSMTVISNGTFWSII